ncbi:MAG: TIGR00725 family protein [Candidatus Helarchaeota archaeon]
MVQIGVIGSGTEIPADIRELAEQVGLELARKGAVLICGGKGGVMEATCKGVACGGGISVGILPSISRTEANKYVKIWIPTNLGENRNYIIIQSVEAVICISGAVGTRMEAEYALMRGVPLIVIPKTGGTSKEMAQKFPDRVLVAETAEEAVEKAFQASCLDDQKRGT